MTDWTWEYVPDAISVVGGLTQTQVDDAKAWHPGSPTRSPSAG